MKLSSFQIGILVVTALLASDAAAKKSLKAGTDASQMAVALLLSVSDEIIPPHSSCHGIFGGDGPPRVRDLLAMELATFSRGKNTLAGTCKADAARQVQVCQVSISHEFGEEASSAEIRFDAMEGRAVVSSLACRLAP